MDDDIHQVLLIAPDAAALSEMTLILEGEFVVLGASSMKAGHELASRREPAVAVIDVSALVGAAEKSVTGLRAASPGLRVVFLSAPGQDAEQAKVLVGLGAVLLKPVAKERLLQAIRNALRLQQMSAGVELLRASTGRYVVGAPLPGAPPDKPGSKS